MNAEEEMEEELDLARQVQTLKVKRSQLENLAPLYQLCIETICNNIDYFCTLKDPFSCLPKDVMEDFIPALQAIHDPDGFHWISARDVIPILLTPNTEYLELQELALYQDGWVAMTALIADKCKDTLKRLHLELLDERRCGYQPCYAHESLMLESTLDMLMSLHNLQVLSITNNPTSHFIINDELMAVLGSCCPRLRELGVSSISDISDKGIDLICNAEEPFGQCRNLIRIKLDGISEFRSKVTERGLMVALINLPNLEVLTHPRILIAVYRLVVQQRVQSLNLRCVHDSGLTSKFRTDLFDTVLQRIKALTMDYPNTNNKIEHLKGLPHVTQLGIFGSNTVPARNIISLANSYSLQLTVLEIFYTTSAIDVSMIAYTCLNLRDIEILAKPKVVCAHILDKRHLSHLDRLYFHVLDSNNKFPDSVLKVALSSSPSLQCVKLSSFELTDEMVSWLVTQAHNEDHVFANVKHVDLFLKTSARNVKKIICIAPKLRTVQVCSLVHGEITDFLLEHRIRCQVNHH